MNMSNPDLIPSKLVVITHILSFWITCLNIYFPPNSHFVNSAADACCQSISFVIVKEELLNKKKLAVCVIWVLNPSLNAADSLPPPIIKGCGMWKKWLSWDGSCMGVEGRREMQEAKFFHVSFNCSSSRLFNWLIFGLFGSAPDTQLTSQSVK